MRILIVLLVVVTASPVSAQIIQPPPRSTGGLFGGRRPPDSTRTAQELTLTMHALGGYDDAISSVDSGAPAGPQQSGYIGTASSMLRFWRGRESRFLLASGRAYVNTYADLGLGELVGGDLDLQAMTRLGGRTALTTGLSLRYQPTFLIRFGPPSDVTEPGVGPDYSATQGVTEQRWLTGTGSLSLNRDWTPRHQTGVESTFTRMQPVSADSGLESENRTAKLRHLWNFRRNGGLRFAYRFSDSLTVDPLGQERRLESQNAELGLALRKQWSATRRLEVGGSAGATRTLSLATADDASSDFVMPSISASVRLDLMRTWALSLDVRRDVSVLQGVSAQPFASDSLLVSAGGTVQGRLRLTVSGGFSRGNARDGATGAYEAVAGTGQLAWDVTRWAAIVTSYNYYGHLMHDIAALPAGFPARYDRNSARVGLALLLPLYGTFQGN